MVAGAAAPGGAGAGGWMRRAMLLVLAREGAGWRMCVKCEAGAAQGGNCDERHVAVV